MESDKQPGQGQTPVPIEAQQAKDQKYAESLAKMAAMDYQMEQAKLPEQKHLISKKWMVYIIISTIVTVISLVVMAITSRRNSSNIPNSGQSEQLLKDTIDTVKDVQQQ